MGTHEFHENWATTISNDSTVFMNSSLRCNELIIG